MNNLFKKLEFIFCSEYHHTWTIERKVLPNTYFLVSALADNILPYFWSGQHVTYLIFNLIILLFFLIPADFIPSVIFFF